MKNIGYGVFLFALTLALSLWAYRIYFRGGQMFEFCHYAEIGRNIIEGRGFSTSTYYPCTLAYLDSRGVSVEPTGPVVDRFPLHSLWVAAFQRIAGKRDFSVVAANVFVHGLWVAAIFGLGQFFFSRRASFWAAFLWAVNPMMIVGFDQMGYADVLFGVLFFAFNCFFFRLLALVPGTVPEAPARAINYFFLGCLAGLAYLARYSFVLWLPFYLILLVWEKGVRGGWRGVLRRRCLLICAAFLAGCLIPVLPWMAYYVSHVGFSSPPLFTWNMAQGVLVGGIPWMEYRTYSLSDFVSLGVILRLAGKWVVYFARFLKDLPTYWNLWLAFPLAAVWLFTRRETSGRAHVFAGVHVALLLWQAVLFSFLRYETLGFMNGRYYLWFAPAVLLCACEFVETGLAPRAGRFRGGVWGLFLAANLVLFGWWYSRLVFPSDHPSGRPVADWPEIVWISKNTPEDAMIVTNIPTQIAWYCRRRTVNITNIPPALKPLLKRHPAQYVFLSYTRIGEIYNYPVWRDVLDGKFGGIERFCEEMGFEVERDFEAGVLLGLVTK